ncbi:MAG TPA: response regulator transcription factor [Chloroflexia bacterium]|nr:response regulator transcription factor [Chloroflexia bacterium]
MTADELPARILVADDEQAILRTLTRNLSRRGYQVITAVDGEEALARIEENLPDIIILDLMMPKVDGLEVCRRVREWSQTPILVLSARGEEQQKVEALDLGADDYLTKPFGMDELLARVRVALRRVRQAKEYSQNMPSPVYSDGELAVDFARREVSLHGEEVKLTPKQYDLLKYLAQNAGRVITHRAALVNVWGPEYGQETQYLHVFINQLRHKIEADPAHPRYILTEPGVGYRFKPQHL